MTERPGECVYCGQTRPLTEDHIPPQCLFGPPRPGDLIRVPSCTECNGGASKDDEYFRTVMVLKNGAGSHPRGRGRPRRRLPGSRERAGTRVQAAHRRQCPTVNLRTPAGLYVGPGATLDVDLARLDRVVARVTRALFWHHYGRRLPDGILMRVFSEGGLRDLHDADRAKVLATVIPVQRNPPQSIGRGVLRYWHAVVPGQEYATAWVPLDAREKRQGCARQQ